MLKKHKITAITDDEKRTTFQTYRKFFIRGRGSYFFEVAWDAASIEGRLLFEGGFFCKIQDLLTHQFSY